MRRALLLLVAAAAAVGSIAVALAPMGDASSAGAPKRRRQAWERRPSHRRAVAEEQNAASALKTLKSKVRELTDALRRVLQPIVPAGGYQMADNSDEKTGMIDWLWAGNFESSVSEMPNANGELCTCPTWCCKT